MNILIISNYLGVGRGVRGYFPEMLNPLRPKVVAEYGNETNQTNFLALGKVTTNNQSNESNQTNQRI